MKKFYISLFTVVFLLTSYLSQGQIYNSIADGNPNGYTYDDPRFWVGGVAPPVATACMGCTIKIYSSTTMVQNGGGTTAMGNVFSGGQTPTDALGHQDGANLITVGMKFSSAVPGNVTGVRFYKLPNMVGPHIGLLYDAGLHVLLGQVNFTGETASGWQDQKFATPIAIANGTAYIIAVYMADGLYTADLNQFNTPITNGTVTGYANGGPAGANGVFSYGAGPTFPATGFNASNYWVDVDIPIDGTFLNKISLANSTVNVYGNTNLTLNTYLELNNSNITIGNDPTSVETFKLNDQIGLIGTSVVQMANNQTTIDANQTTASPIQGPFKQIGNLGVFAPGIYSVNAADPQGYTATLQADGLGSETNQYFPPPLLLNYYDLNCNPAVAAPNDCTDGIVYGPAITQLAPNPLFGVVFIQSTTLPVQLVKFIATKNADGTVLLSWATSQEENSGYFDVERSTDQTGWTKIGSVKAKGFSSITTNYNFTDQFPLDKGAYYHLKMVDLDGKTTYSKPVSVSGDDNNVPLVIYSNPFSDMIRMKVNVSRSQNLQLTVSDMLGRTYISETYPAQIGDNYINLNKGVGGSGMYILRIHGDSYDQTVKLEKQ